MSDILPETPLGSPKPTVRVLRRDDGHVAPELAAAMAESSKLREQLADLLDLSRRRGMVQEMAERLERTGYREAARATRNVLYLIDGAKRAADALSDVWHAAEWADSGDYGEGKVAEEVAKLQPWPPEGTGER